MKALILDAEMNAIKNPDKVHCVCVRELSTDAGLTFTNMIHFKSYIKHFDTLIGHNIARYDIPYLEQILDCDLSNHTLLDTYVMSQMYDFKIDGGHSLKAWGQRLGNYKGDFNGPWDVLTDDMLKYCIQDVEVTHLLFNHLIKKMPLDSWKDAIALESFIARKCFDMNKVGFYYHKEQADVYRDEYLTPDIKNIDEHITKAYPPVVVSGRVGKNGRSLKDQIIEFNPNSVQQVIDKLWEAGWKPFDKTKGHIEFSKTPTPEPSYIAASIEYYRNKDKYDRYGWKVNENNLATLLEDAPMGIKLIVTRMILESRRRKLDEWAKAYDDTTHRIHGTFDGLGTWSQRMSHTKPNMANISAKKSIKYKSEELNALATHWGGQFRQLWQASPGHVLVGTDAEGIQLRVLAHYMNDPEFTHAVTFGKKEDGTDPHTMNMKRLGNVCNSRDTSKTFIYAFLLNAGNAKIGEILGISAKAGGRVKESFTNSYPGLAHLKGEVIPRDARRGYFCGLDGRLVRCESEHLMMAGYLQNGEAVIMKLAVKIACDDMKRFQIPATLINMVHDEMIFECPTMYGEAVKEITERAISDAGKMLKLNCAMKGEGKIGNNWLETH